MQEEDSEQEYKYSLNIRNETDAFAFNFDQRGSIKGDYSTCPVQFIPFPLCILDDELVITNNNNLYSICDILSAGINIYEYCVGLTDDYGLTKSNYVNYQHHHNKIKGYKKGLKMVTNPLRSFHLRFTHYLDRQMEKNCGIQLFSRQCICNNVYAILAAMYCYTCKMSRADIEGCLGVDNGFDALSIMKDDAFWAGEMPGKTPFFPIYTIGTFPCSYGIVNQFNETRGSNFLGVCHVAQAACKDAMKKFCKDIKTIPKQTPIDMFEVLHIISQDFGDLLHIKQFVTTKTI